MNWWLVCLFAFALAACASQQQLMVNDDAKCRGYGFQPGTDGYAQCRMAQDTSRQRRRQQALQDMGDAVEQAGNSFQRQPPPSLYCTSVASGKVMSTNCY